MLHTDPELSAIAMHELFNKINEFDSLYGCALSGDDLTDYSDGQSITSQASTAFDMRSSSEFDADSESDSNA